MPDDEEGHAIEHDADADVEAGLDEFDWPYDLNRPWLLPPSGAPYPVASDPRVEALVDKWREIVVARDELVTRTASGDTRAQADLASFDTQLVEYPSPRRFEEIVRQLRAREVEAAVSALVWVLREVRRGRITQSAAEQDGDVEHAADACRVDVKEIVRVVFHAETQALLGQNVPGSPKVVKMGPVRAAVRALEALGTFGSEATIHRRVAEHRSARRAAESADEETAIKIDDF